MMNMVDKQTYKTFLMFTRCPQSKITNYRNMKIWIWGQ